MEHKERDPLQEMTETVRRKQALAEERQTLLNKWQRERDEALAELEQSRKEQAEMRSALKKTEERMRGYENQFSNLQKATQNAQEQIQVLSRERDQAWSQFRDRDEKLAAMGAELSATAADRDNAWAQFNDREAQLDAARRELNDRREQNGELEAQLRATAADRDNAWAQFNDREAQLDQVRRELQAARDQADSLRVQLTDAKQYGAEMAMKAGEMEKLFAVKVYKKLHREA